MQIKVWLRREQYANSQQREKFPVDFYIRGDGRTKSEYKIKIWIHRKVLVGGNLFDSRGIRLESFRGEFLRRSIDFEINRMRDSISMGGWKKYFREKYRCHETWKEIKKKFAMKFFVVYLFILNLLLL